MKYFAQCGVLAAFHLCLLTWQPGDFGHAALAFKAPVAIRVKVSLYVSSFSGTAFFLPFSFHWVLLP